MSIALDKLRELETRGYGISTYSTETEGYKFTLEKNKVAITIPVKIQTPQKLDAMVKAIRSDLMRLGYDVPKPTISGNKENIQMTYGTWDSYLGNIAVGPDAIDFTLDTSTDPFMPRRSFRKHSPRIASCIDKLVEKVRQNNQESTS